MVTERETVAERLDHARGHLAAAERSLTARAPGPGELYAAVNGAMRVCITLADLVATAMRQAPAALGHTHEGGVLEELLADLRAMHGCLITGPPLLEPGRDDLHRLVTGQHGRTPMSEDFVPVNDAADQQRPAQPEPADTAEAEDALEGVEEVLEADPADVADQRRDAPVLAEGEPWP